MKFLLTATFAAALALPAAAETVYIKDVLIINLRAEPSSSSPVLGRFRTGDAFELLEQSEDKLWSKIKNGNKTGYMQSSYLVDEPIAALRLAKAEAELKKLTEENSKMTAALSGIKSDALENDTIYQDITAERDNALAELERIKKVSADAIRIDEYNTQLISDNRKLQSENEQLANANQALKSDKSTYQWVIGGALVVIGLVLGFVARNLGGGRRRADGWS